MQDYCDIIRSDGADAVIPMTVGVGETLTGELNGAPLPEGGGDGGDGGDTGGEFQTISDDTGALTVDAPADWIIIPAPGAQDIGPAVAASADGTDFTAGFTVVGMLYVATKTEVTDIDSLFPVFVREGCTAEAIADYDDGVFKGRFQTFSQCAGTESFYDGDHRQAARGKLHSGRRGPGSYRRGRTGARADREELHRRRRPVLMSHRTRPPQRPTRAPREHP